jgi:pyrroloquinoline-quinone synthase
VDHDGDGSAPGGVERWLKLTDGLGLDRDYVVSLRGLLPATRFAVDAYVAWVRDRSVLEAIASSLTEMFSPNIISQRVSGMLRNYDFVTPETLAYFTPRLTQAPQDVAFALDYVKRVPRNREEQEQVLAALRFKCDLLWAQLDALHFAYVEPGLPPPGAFRP